MKKTFLMLGAAVVMSMAASSCKAVTKTFHDADEDEDYSVEEVSEEMGEEVAIDTNQAPAAAAAPAVNLQGDVKVDTTGYTTTASGLMYKKVKGNGKSSKHPSATSAVMVHYTGKHLNGEVFDSSVERGEPITFPLNQVIPGWTEGVQLMTVGDTYQFIIPSALAYGQRGAGPIAPGEDLYFEVELLDIPE